MGFLRSPPVTKTLLGGRGQCSIISATPAAHIAVNVAVASGSYSSFTKFIVSEKSFLSNDFCGSVEKYGSAKNNSSAPISTVPKLAILPSLSNATSQRAWTRLLLGAFAGPVSKASNMPTSSGASIARSTHVCYLCHLGSRTR
jgi:nitrogen fixation protein FixH